MTTAKLSDEQKVKVRNRAIEEYVDDDVEVDTNAVVIRAGDEGYWVAAWVYVKKEGEE